MSNRVRIPGLSRNSVLAHRKTVLTPNMWGPALIWWILVSLPGVDIYKDIDDVAIKSFYKFKPHLSYLLFYRTRDIVERPSSRPNAETPLEPRG